MSLQSLIATHASSVFVRPTSATDRHFAQTIYQNPNGIRAGRTAVAAIVSLDDEDAAAGMPDTIDGRQLIRYGSLEILESVTVTAEERPENRDTWSIPDANGDESDWQTVRVTGRDGFNGQPGLQEVKIMRIEKIATKRTIIDR